MITWAVVRHRFAGVHRWPDAPKGPHEHLRNAHRHLFHITLQVQVFHDDRELEYLAVRDWLVSVCASLDVAKPDLQPRSDSCEMIAKDIAKRLKRDFPHPEYLDALQKGIAVDIRKTRAVRVEVIEDGENGAIVED